MKIMFRQFLSLLLLLVGVRGALAQNVFPPVISVDLTNVTVTAGDPASFSVQAVDVTPGTPDPITYQWTLNGVAIPEATNATYSLATTSSTDDGSAFQVVVANPVGSARSAIATLTVLPFRSCVPPPPNLVLWLPFDETGGLSTANRGSPAFYGTKVGNPATLTGAYVANSLAFNGLNQYVSVPDYPALEIGTNSLTIDAWVNRSPNNPNSPPSVIVDKRDPNTYAGYSLALSYGNLVLQLNGVNYRDTSGVVPPDGRWHFVAVTVHQTGAAATAQFYVDGAATTATAVAGGNLSNSSALWVGASPIGGNQPWLGDLDEIEVFNRALAPAELLAIYQAGTAGKCKSSCVAAPANMILWLPLDETTGPTSANLAAPSFPGTQVGSPTVWTGAYVANSLKFNGVNQYVTVPDYAALEIGANSLTIDAWVNRAVGAPNSFPSVIVDKRNVNTGVGYSLSLSYGNLILTLNGANFRDHGVIPADGRWHFVAVTVNRASSAAQFYVDGLVTSTVGVPAGNLANTYPLWVGASPLGGNRPWLGALDEIEIFNRALAVSELQAIYLAGPAGKCRPSCVRPPANLGLWLPFDETTGLHAANLAAGGHAGTLFNGPTHDLTGFVDHSLSFSGANQFVAVPDYAAIDPGFKQDFSLDAWVRRPVGAPNSPPCVVLDKRDPVSHLGYSLSVDYGHVFLTMSGYNAADVTDQVPADGHWHFIAVTVARNQVNGGHFYVDGNAPVAFTPVNVNLTTTAPFIVGKSLTDPGANQPWIGGIDEVEYFNRALTAAEVASLYQAGAAGKCKPTCVAAPANLALWLPMDETAGPTSANLASLANPGTQVGGPTVNFGGYVANSLNFNGVNQYVKVSDYAAIEIGTNNLTIDAWVNRTNTAPNSPPAVIVDKRDVNSGVGYSLSLSFGNLILTLNGVNYRDNLGVIPPDGQWHFVAVSVNQNPAAPSAQFYVDGVATAALSVAPGNLSNANALWAGASPLAGNRPWWGGLDEIEVFNRALAGAELQAIYQAGSAGKCKPGRNPGLTVTAAPDQTVVCGTAWQFTAPQATSDCANGVAVTVASLGIQTNGSCPQTVSQSWQVADGCGNTAVCRQTITIVDPVPPVIQCPTGALIVPRGPLGTLVVPAVTVSATDNCTPPAQLLFAQSPPAGTVVPGPRAYVTVTVTDGCGNSSHCVVELAGVKGGYGPQVLNDNGWSYLDTGANLGSAWRGLTFNAAAWPTNPAPFGAGAFPAVSPLAPGHTTYYFRNNFWVPNAAAVTNLLVNYQCVAGAVIYLNGTEVARNNLPTGSILATTTALTNVAGTAESQVYTNALNPAQLLTGNNVLAVEIHTAKGGGDAGFALSLVAGNGPGGPQRITSLVAPAGATNLAVYYRNLPGAAELDPGAYTLQDAQLNAYPIADVLPGATANEVLLSLAQPLASVGTFQLTSAAAVSSAAGGGPLPYAFATSVVAPEILCPSNITAYVCDPGGQAFVDLNYGYFFGATAAGTIYTWTDYNGSQSAYAAGMTNSWFYPDFGDFFPVGTFSAQFMMGSFTCDTLITVTNITDVTSVGDATVCAGGSVTLTANPTAINPTYLWSDGETNASITVSPATTTTYSVTVQNGLTGCSSTGSATVTVNPAPSVTVNSGTACAGSGLTLQATVTGDAAPFTYAWSGPGGFTAGGAAINALVPGTYSVVVTDTNGCTATGLGSFIDTPPPGVTVNSVVVCAGGTATLTATATAANPSYLWTPGGAITPSLTVTPGATTTYSVVVTDTATGCVSSPATGTVTVLPAPQVSVNSGAVCAGGSLTLTATVGAGVGPFSYAWTGPAGFPPANTAAISASLAGTYSVTVTDANGCTGTGSGVLGTNSALGVLVNSGTNCAGGSFTMNGTVLGGVAPFTYAWTGPNGFTANTPSIGAVAAGTYTLTVTDHNGCTGTGTGFLVTAPKPTVVVSQGCISPTATTVMTVTVSGAPGPFTYSWTGPAPFAGATTATITPVAVGTYTVLVTTAGGCQAFGVGQCVNCFTNPCGPVIQCPTNSYSVTMDADCCFRIPLVTVPATDPCYPVSQLKTTQNPPPNTRICNGTTATVIVTVTDPSGKSATCHVQVNGVPGAPVLSGGPTTLTVTNCQVPCVTGLFHISSCCPPSSFQITQTPPCGSPFGPGVNRVKITVTDCDGRSTIKIVKLVANPQDSFLSSLFSTGAANDAASNPVTLIGPGVDPYYTLGPVPAGTSGYTAPQAILPQVFPTAWMLPPIYPNAASWWIGPSIRDENSPVGVYWYTNQFVLPPFADPTTASISGRWAVDNTGVILLNNQTTPAATIPQANSASYQSWHGFNLTQGFLGYPQVNTLRFAVNNAPGGTRNPTGLRVEYQDAYVNCNHCVPPSIFSISQTYPIFDWYGNHALLTVVAQGTGPFTYHWYHNGLALTDGGVYSGTQTATLSVNPITKANAGQYSVVVCNACGCASAQVAAVVRSPLYPVDPAPYPVNYPGLWTFSAVANPLMATVGPDLSLVGPAPEQFSPTAGNTFDFGLPNPGAQVLDVMHVAPLPADTMIQIPQIAPPGSNSVGSYSVVLDILQPSTAAGPSGTLFENLGSSGQDGVALSLDSQQVLHLTTSVAGTVADTAAPLPLGFDAWHRVALVIDDPHDGVGLTASAYTDGQLVATQFVPATSGLPINWADAAPSLLSRQTNDLSLLTRQTNDLTQTSDFYVAAVQFHTIALPGQWVAALGATGNSLNLTDASVAVQPTLSVIPANGLINLTWTGAAWQLQDVGDLTTGAWSNSALPFTQSQDAVGNPTTVAVLDPGAAGPQKFYRLVPAQ